MYNKNTKEYYEISGIIKKMIISRKNKTSKKISKLLDITTSDEISTKDPISYIQRR